MSSEFIQKIVSEINFCRTEIQKWQTTAEKLLEIVKIHAPDFYGQIESEAKQIQTTQVHPTTVQHKQTELISDNDLNDIFGSQDDIFIRRNNAYDRMMREEQARNNNPRVANLGYSIDHLPAIAEMSEQTVNDFDDEKIKKLNKLMTQLDDDLPENSNEFDKYKIHVVDEIVDEIVDESKISTSVTQELQESKKTESKTLNIKETQDTKLQDVKDTQDIKTEESETIEEFEEIEDLGEVLDGLIGIKKDTYVRKQKDDVSLIQTRLQKAIRANVRKPYEPEKKETVRMTPLHLLTETEQTDLYEQIYITAKENVKKTFGEKRIAELTKKEFDAAVRKECDNLLEVAMSRPGKPYL